MFLRKHSYCNLVIIVGYIAQRSEVGFLDSCSLFQIWQCSISTEVTFTYPTTIVYDFTRGMVMRICYRVFYLSFTDMSIYAYNANAYIRGLFLKQVERAFCHRRVFYLSLHHNNTYARTIDIPSNTPVELGRSAGIT